MLFRAQALISQAALFHNLDCLAEHAEADILLPVKANAYGHGFQIVEWAAQHPRVWGFGVGTPQEAMSLYRAGYRSIVLLGVARPSEITELSSLGIGVSISHWEHARAVIAGGRAHLKVNTGMNRLGARPREAYEIGTWLANQGLLEGVYTHFASADAEDLSTATQQLICFQEVMQTLKAPFYHVANSGGVLSFGHIEGMNLIRPGLASYGYAPAHLQADLKPVMTLRAQIVLIQEVPAGEQVSYGGLWTAPRHTRVAVVAIGYADGYPRSASLSAHVSVAGECRPILGRVCMDQLMIDVTDLPVRVNDWVELWGEEVKLSTVSHWSDRIEYELLTSIGERVERVGL